ncbi:MAG: alpha/beta hydrolase family protein [Armatimonadetes bacterium]|nr:alpha/beta hydrolase family protein [Armatimonadota bacterium]MDW8121558.1 alpha/beta hydrolase family protein [Armatimonadota bacterium]
MAEEALFDPMPWLMRLYETTQQRLFFSASDRAEARHWQERFRQALLQTLGGWPEKAPDLDVRVFEVKELVTTTDDGRSIPYRRETLAFQSQPGLYVFAYFLSPLSNDQRRPVIICLHGHGRGVDDIVGIEEDGKLRDRWGGYHRDFALQSVAHGFSVLAIEQLGFGRRRLEEARRQGPHIWSCLPMAGSAFLLGQTMVMWRVFDVICGLDYLATRNDVFSERVAVMGLSGGGTTSLYAAALEPRIKAAVISGYFNTFKDSIYSLIHCTCNYVPEMLRIGEMPDVAALIAPRPLHIESGTKDAIFPVEATKRGFERLSKVYEVFGAQDRLTLNIFEGEHIFNGEGAFPFLKKWL